jgi:O-methyltransferase
LENPNEPSIQPTLDEQRVETINRLLAQDRERVETIAHLLAQDRERVEAIARLLAQDRERIETIDRLLAQDRERIETIDRLSAQDRAGEIEHQIQLAEALFVSEELNLQIQMSFEALDRERVVKINNLIAQDEERVTTINRLVAQDEERVAIINRLMTLDQAGQSELHTQLSKAIIARDELHQQSQMSFKALDRERVVKINNLVAQDEERVETINRLLAQDSERVAVINEVDGLLKESQREYLDFEKEESLRADGLEVTGRNLEFLRNPDFVKAWETAKKNNFDAWRGNVPDVRWRAHIAVWAARQALNVEGDFVECGVYAGLLSGTICSALKFASVKKRFFLFDTFTGIPDNELPDAGSDRIKEINSHYVDVRKIVRKNFLKYSNVKIVEGILPGTLPKARIGKISYLSVDLNTAETERQVIEYLWPKVSPGGIVLIDDYGWSACSEQYVMWNNFANKQGLAIACLPTGQGLLIKPHLEKTKDKGKS